MNDYLQQQFGLKGKRALVTGGARGIGRAIVEALSAAGAEVFVHYNKSSFAADELVKHLEKQGGKAFSAGADLTDSGSGGYLRSRARSAGTTARRPRMLPSTPQIRACASTMRATKVCDAPRAFNVAYSSMFSIVFA